MKGRILCTIVLSLAGASTGLAQQAMVTGPHALVYKTKGNYRKLVPVVLSDDKATIVSSPDPRDVKAGGTRLLPTELHKGYLLDNRGISANTAFINMTVGKYAALPAAPSPAELYKMIIDKDPIVMLCDCGKKSAFKHPAADLNKLIGNKKLLKTCTLLKGKK